MILADLGAEVVKVEQPEIGDRSRSSGPFIDGESTYFMSVNRGKLGFSVDLSKPKGKDLFLQLVDNSDVILENFAPGTMQRLGLDYHVLRDRNPAIIYAAISGFGQDGPYSSKPALDVVVQGMGGILSITGEPGGPPIRPGVSQGDITAGLFAVIGILSALQERTRSGLGQMVDIGMLDCQVTIQENAFARYFATGEVPTPLGTRHPVTAPFQVFQTSDGYITIALIEGRKERWPLLCSAIDRIDLIDDPRFDTGWTRSQNHHELEPILLGGPDEEDLPGMAGGAGGAGDRVRAGQHHRQGAQDPQVNHRGMIKEYNHSRLGKVRAVNTPVKLSRTPTGNDSSSPDLGEHTDDLLRDLLGMQEQEIASLREEEVI
ncbi:Succinate--hydroxymethylglutarate CoA-transferase [Geodia barretti]|uniref:Succinate--hydroxymethylglutarate CoA-transferase n=1 Tax=Geodia barretti TaxID=519541 RepID=A0AA35TUY5_GEOBA|nr:Succinate--hydroxymethylglutarate CoA-transferase [Geodia barretti]